MEVLSNFVESLKELLFQHNLTAAELAEKISSQESRIYKYLRGEYLPSTATAIKLANVFNCSLEYLFGRADSNYSQIFHECPPFGERLPYLWKKFNTNHYRMQKATDIADSAIQNWQKGKYLPNVENLIKLADFFGCSIDFVLGRER